LLLSRQGEGRATKKYSYSSTDVLEGYYRNNLNDNQERELKLRICSSPIYKVAIERFVFDSIITYLQNNNIDYKNYYSPNSADFAITLDNNALNRIHEANLIEPEYDGIILNVDSKSVMGLANMGDALSNGNVLGKFEAKWNQLSYEPPILRTALVSGDYLLNNKYGVLRNTILINNENYLLVTLFVCDLIYLSHPTDLLNLPLRELNGSIFDHLIHIECVPNGLLHSPYYDSYFSAGKGGYEVKTINSVRYQYPKDCRFQIRNAKGQNLVFNNLHTRPNRFRYLSNNQTTFFGIILNDNRQLIRKQISLV
jgi:hypothetical protein